MKIHGNAIRKYQQVHIILRFFFSTFRPISSNIDFEYDPIKAVGSAGIGFQNFSSKNIKVALEETLTISTKWETNMVVRTWG